jgi:hypothetical protein
MARKPRRMKDTFLQETLKYRQDYADTRSAILEETKGRVIPVDLTGFVEERMPTPNRFNSLDMAVQHRIVKQARDFHDKIQSLAAGSRDRITVGDLLDW